MSLAALIEATKQESFVEPVETSDEQALGVLIAKHFQWSGRSILRTAAYALEDANFHTQAAQLEEMERGL